MLRYGISYKPVSFALYDLWESILIIYTTFAFNAKKCGLFRRIRHVLHLIAVVNWSASPAHLYGSTPYSLVKQIQFPEIPAC